MWQQLIVALVVAAAALHFCTKYMPAAWRRQAVHAFTRRGYDQDRLARLFNTQSSCGSEGCNSCGSCDDTPAAAPSGGPARRVIKLHVQR